jgi:hypothetical protein
MTQYVPGHWAPAPVRRTSALAGWSLGLGIAGLFLGLFTLGIPCFAAIAMGHQALTDTRDGAKGGRGMAIAGLVLGYAAVVPAVGLCVYYAVSTLINLP